VGPTDLVGSPHDLLKTFQKIPQTTLFITTSRLGVQDKTSVDLAQSRSTGYGKMCNVDLGLLVITDQESGNRPGMNPLGFVPDLSMRGVDNSIEEEMTFSARLQPFKAAP
jgi:hypothetical protein